uniref:Uncharacterized protein n=1 Tax=Physcomitrium patens TaxID=3218 RepID=A0A7I4C597_PHYPA
MHLKRVGAFTDGLLLLLMAAAVSTASHEVVRFQCPEAILAFGGSSTDTGEAQSFTGERELDFVTASQFLPYGITYFGHPADRYSDGRLIIDFLSQAFGLRLLDPYFDNIAPDFRQGINFATGGANVRRVESIDVVPIYLGLQVNQAIRFYHKSLDVPSGALGAYTLFHSRLVLSASVCELRLSTNSRL